MKKFKYIAMAFAALLFASCMGDGYADPDNTIKVPNSPYGNNALADENVITIAQLKSDYKSTIDGDSYKYIDKDIKIKGYVTGNDIGGNLYQEISVQDETGALLVCINAGALHGYLVPGQQILIDLKGLYVGGYGKQAEVGSIYTNLKTGATSIGKMDRPTWQKHFKLIGEANEANVTPIEFDLTKVKDASYLEENAGKLMVLRGVSFQNADGKTVYAPNDKTTDRYLIDANTNKNISSSNLVVRTSGYAKFANAALPEGTYDITGIFTRYKNVWQILLRNTDDLKKVVLVKGGTKDDPYTVTSALKIINAGTYTKDEVYVQGIICSDPSVSDQYGDANYEISEDGNENSPKIKVFQGYYLDKAKFDATNKDKIQKGQKVVICGALTMYNGTPEINKGNYLISIQ